MNNRILMKILYALKNINSYDDAINSVRRIASYVNILLFLILNDTRHYFQNFERCLEYRKYISNKKGEFKFK